MSLNAKNKTLLFVSIVITLFSIVLVSAIYIHQKERLLKAEHEFYDNVESSYEKILSRHQQFYYYRTLANVISDEVIKAFAAEDREKLFALTNQQWKILQKENPHLRVMHFHLPDGRSFLRMHEPRKYGDQIANFRPMVATVHKEKKVMYGFEAGVFNLAYRTFVPLFQDTTYIGALEFGVRPDEFLLEMKHFSGLEGALFVKNYELNLYKEESSIVYGGYTLQYHTLRDNAILSHLQKSGHDFETVKTVEFGGKTYNVYAFPLKDFAGNISAQTVFLQDVTQLHQEFETTIEEFVLFVFGLLVIVLFTINFGFKKIVSVLDQTNDELQKNKRFLQSVLDNSAYAIITTNTDGLITGFNIAAEKMLGYEADELVYKRTVELLHLNDEVMNRSEQWSKELGIRVKLGFESLIIKTNFNLNNEHEWTYVHKDGHTFPVLLSVTALRNENGIVVGYVGLARDISSEKEASRQLLRSKELLAEAQKIAKIGSWSLDFASNELEWTDEIFRIFELDLKEFGASYEAFLHAIHPDDVAAVQSAFTESVEKKKPYRITHRLLMSDGRIKYVEENGKTVYDEKGVPLLSQGTVQDVTASKRLEKKITDYVALVNESVITSTTDLEGTIVYVSNAFCRISQYDASDLIGQNHRIVRHSDMPEEVYRELWDTITDNRTWEGEIKNKAKDGSHYWVHATISPIWDDEGNKIGYTAVRQDITDKKRVEELAVRDRLTGLFNRLKLDEILEYEMTKTKRYNTPLSVIIIDVDHFKSVNDTYGHQVGDLVLKEVANILMSYGRKSDTVGRWGGEEFLIILPNTDLGGAMLAAEKIRVAIANHLFSVVGHKTASLGVSQLLLNETETAFIERADKALYRAKAGGRNQVVG
ncbi:MAG: diguanylate cyclase [Campylobacterales bacterium]|nr:diguanylate cyclase [Campylobacterales bacterium]